MSLDVGPAAEFPDGQVSVVTVGRAEIGIIRWCGKIYAIGAVCAHQGGPLCRGVLAPRLDARRPGELIVADAAPVIACPWHGWEYDVGTGEAIWDRSVRVRTFPVEVIAGRVMVETADDAGAGGSA
jgi:nitrite reductase/ring-hydroxylating ferredoxin subunit